MSKKNTSPPPAAPAPVKGALTAEQIDAKLKEVAAFNADARQRLEAAFNKERWSKLHQQAVRQGVTDEALTALCGKMLRTRADWHPDKPAAALQGACNGLLIALGSTLTEADVKAYEEAQR